MKIQIQYRIDKRIKVVEVKTGTRIFLVELDDFSFLTGLRDFEESVQGDTTVDIGCYKKLYDGRITHARPHSFRFRRAKREDESH